MRGVIVGWVPPSLPPLHKRLPPHNLIASKCFCPYANRISEAFRIDVVNKSMFSRSTTKPPILYHKSMFLRSTTKPPILEVLTKTYISVAFRIDFVNRSMFLRSTTKPPIFNIRGRFDQKMFFMDGVIVPPSKLIVTNMFSPQGGGFY